jgi:hypothetical protein
MKFNTLLKHYQRDFLTEKDYRGFNGLRKLGDINANQKVTAIKNKNEFRPYNDSSKTLSTNTDQQLKIIDNAKSGTVLPISPAIAQELAHHYNKVIDNTEKKLNSKGNISIFKTEKGYMLKKN